VWKLLPFFSLSFSRTVSVRIRRCLSPLRLDCMLLPLPLHENGRLSLLPLREIRMRLSNDCFFCIHFASRSQVMSFIPSALILTTHSPYIDPEVELAFDIFGRNLQLCSKLFPSSFFAPAFSSSRPIFLSLFFPSLRWVLSEYFLYLR